MRGLRRFDDESAGALTFQHLKNLRPTERGLRHVVPISQPMTDSYISGLGINKSWPFPQIFRGRNVTLMVSEDEIFEVTETAGNWTAVPVSLWDAAGFDKGFPIVGSLTGGGPWQFLDLGDGWVLFNGVDVVFKTGHQRTDPYATSAVTIRAGCNHRYGRVFYGGFDETNIYSLFDWNAYFADFDDNAPDQTKAIIDALSVGPGSNWVNFGTIGGGDVLWWVSEMLARQGWADVNSLTNGQFDTDTDWSHGVGWSITGGKLVVLRAVASGTIQLNTSTAVPINTGTYRVRFVVSDYVKGTIALSFSGGSYTLDIVSGDGPVELDVAVTGSDNSFELWNTDDTELKIDNITIQNLYDSPNGDEYLFDLIQRKQFGFMPMPWAGDVISMLPLGQHVAVYGAENATSHKNGGATILTTNQSAIMGVEAIRGFGERVGVAGRGAVGGDESQHVFVDEFGELWLVDADFQAYRFYSREFFEPMLGTDIVVSFDEHEKEFYISNEESCYLLGKDGLSQVKTHPTSVFIAQGVQTGITFVETEPSDGELQLTTQPVDAGSIGGMHGDIFTVHALKIRTKDIQTTGWQAIVYYRMNQEDDWTASSELTFAKDGLTYPNLACLEFYVAFTHEDSTETNGLDGLAVEVSLDEKPGSRQWLNAAVPGDIEV